MEEDLNFKMFIGKWKMISSAWLMEEDLNVFLNGRQEQFTAGLAIPSFSWAWHSSAPACFFISLESVIFWMSNVDICIAYYILFELSLTNFILLLYVQHIKMSNKIK